MTKNNEEENREFRMVLASPEYDDVESLSRCMLTISVGEKLRWFNIYADGVITLRASLEEGAVLESFGEQGEHPADVVKDACKAIEDELGIDCKYALGYIAQNLRQGVINALIHTGEFWSKDGNNTYRHPTATPSLCLVKEDPIMGAPHTGIDSFFVINFLDSPHKDLMDMSIHVNHKAGKSLYMLFTPQGKKDFCLRVMHDSLTAAGLAKVFQGLIINQGFYCSKFDLQDIFNRTEGKVKTYFDA